MFRKASIQIKLPIFISSKEDLSLSLYSPSHGQRKYRVV
jgi:hypothetical protein